MALRDLLAGECGQTSSLGQLSSHFGRDIAHKEDGLCRTLPTRVEAVSTGNTDQLVEEFIGESVKNAPQTFRMDDLLQEMRQIQSSPSSEAPELKAPDDTSVILDDPSWNQAYLDSERQVDEEPHEIGGGCPSKKESIADSQGEVFELGFGPDWVQGYLQSRARNVDFTPWSRDSNIDLDENWQEHPIDTTNVNELQEAADQLFNNVIDPNLNASKFMKFMTQIASGGVTKSDSEVLNSNGNETDKSVADVGQKEEERSQEASKLMEREMGMDKLWKEAEKVKKEISDDVNENPDNSAGNIRKLWSNFQDEWDRMFPDDNVTDQPWASEYSVKLKLGSLPSVAENPLKDKFEEEEMSEQPWISEFCEKYDPYKMYPFQSDNPMQNKSGALEEGKKRLAEGDLCSAVLCFEAAVLNEPENAEAWELLGITQAENEQDPSAISALKYCLKLNPGNLKALMGLAISYTNESFQNQACIVLREWLKQNTKYNHLVPNDRTPWKGGLMSYFLYQDVHKEVRDLYIAAARLHPTDNIDPDVQCGLGVLFNLSREFGKAVDCFRAALEVKPEDSRLWNRLGATLANGGRFVEAVEAYDQTLKLSPSFIRARYNLGISCVSLGAQKEAAEHLLLALNQQAKARGYENTEKTNAMSTSIWSTLRLVIKSLDRKDLLEAVLRQDLLELNKAFNVD